MANKARGRCSAHIFPDDIKTKLSGFVEFDTVDAGDKWVFTDMTVTTSTNGAQLLTSAVDFLSSGVALADGDKIEWMALKNLSTTVTDGVNIVFDGGNVAWNTGDAIFIGSGEMVILKPSNATIADLIGISVTSSGLAGKPSGTNSSSTEIIIAAIIDDVSFGGG